MTPPGGGFLGAYILLARADVVALGMTTVLTPRELS
jgi:hypothetical protein